MPYHEIDIRPIIEGNPVPTPFEEMTDDELRVERAAILAEERNLAAAERNLAAAERKAAMASYANGTAAVQAAAVADLYPTPPGKALEDDEDEVPAPWPHQHMAYAGLDLEVRKPGEAALIGVSMVSSEGVDGNVRLRVFTRFLRNHLSEASFVTVVEQMTDPDSDTSIQGLITALTEVAE